MNQAQNDFAFKRLSGPAERAGRLSEGAPGLETALDVRLPSGPCAVASARAAIGALERQLDAETAEDLRLLVSELVTNSVRHAESTGVHVRVWLARKVVHVEIVDEGPGFVPVPRAASEAAPGGWGLYLVDRLADRWGVAREGATRVWFQLERAARGRTGNGGLGLAAG